MQRIALVLSYNGSRYYGWQKQHASSNNNHYDYNCYIQSIIESALSKIANHKINVCVAGRTDRGVHAIGQVVHFDTMAKRTYSAWINGVNSFLPNDIRVQRAYFVDNTFHARFSATSRVYCYYLYTGSTQIPFFDKLYAWHNNFKQDLNIKAMQEACDYLIGKHDFSAFRSSQCTAKNPVKNMIEARVTEVKSDFFDTIQHGLSNPNRIIEKSSIAPTIEEGNNSTICNRDQQQNYTNQQQNYTNQQQNTISFNMGQQQKIIECTFIANSFLQHMIRNIMGVLIMVGEEKYHPSKMQEFMIVRDRKMLPATFVPDGLYLSHIIYPAQYQLYN